MKDTKHPPLESIKVSDLKFTGTPGWSIADGMNKSNTARFLNSGGWGKFCKVYVASIGFNGLRERIDGRANLELIAASPRLLSYLLKSIAHTQLDNDEPLPVELQEEGQAIISELMRVGALTNGN